MIAPLNEWTKLGNYVRKSPDGAYKIQKTELGGETHYLAYRKTGGRISGWCKTREEAWQACADDAAGSKVAA